MNLSKYLKKIFLKNNFIIFLKKEIDPRPYLQETEDNKDFESYSDCFPWRTDSNFITHFRFFNLLGIFYNINRENITIEIQIFSKFNKLLKKLYISEIKENNEFIISKEFLDLEDYGFFNIFHKVKNTNELLTVAKTKIQDKSYVGFSRPGNVPSFVHGNIPIKANNKKTISTTDLVYKSFFMNKIYNLQCSFNDHVLAELFFSNPSSKKIKFSIEDTTHVLQPYNSKIIRVKKLNSLIKIKSNCSFLRPYVFVYNKIFFDCYHS